MSGVIGKGTKSLKKLKDSNSLVPNIGFKSLQFMHEASAGDTTIDLQNLTASAAAVGNGFVQPTNLDLASVNLTQFQSNLVLRSDQRESLIPFIDYVVSGTQLIKLINPALAGEIFVGTLLSAPKNGVSLADAQPLVSTGTLAAGDTDFNVGTPFEVGKFPTEQTGSVMVFVDGVLAYRNVNNQDDTEGDYYEVNAGGGLGLIVRFNDPDLINDREIVVVSVGSLVEKPQESILAVMENLQGQLDKVIPALAQVAGLPETDFYTAPNNVDLKAFGDLVNSNEDRITALEENPVPSAIIYRLGGGHPTLNDAAGLQQVQFDTIEHNDGGSSFVDLPNYQIVIQEAGLYEMSASFLVGDITPGITYFITIEIHVNGVVAAKDVVISTDIPESTVEALSISRPKRLNQGDTVEVFAAQDNSGGVNFSVSNTIENTWLAVTRLGP